MRFDASRLEANEAAGYYTVTEEGPAPEDDAAVAVSDAGDPGSQGLEAGTDYDITYSGMSASGTGAMVLSFKGN